MADKKSIYLRRVMEQVPRLLSQQDRVEGSKTYGCFDRNYWHYKVVDFPCARHQEAALTLAMLYKCKDASPYYKNEKIRQWAEAAIAFWEKIQATDGSFSEWYPNEHSFVATSFSTLAAAQTSRLLAITKFKDSISRACTWLAAHDEPMVSNQMAGSILTLEESQYLRPEYDPNIILPRLKTLLSRQTPEGWFWEYQGFDAGYSYVLLDYLARLWELRNKEGDDENAHAIAEACGRLIEFLSYFVHPDGSVGKHYTSRSTGYIIPSGLEIMSSNPTARAIADMEIQNLQEKPIIWDDRYLCYQLYYHLIAHDRQNQSTPPAELPFQKSFEKKFIESGLSVKSDGLGLYEINSDDGRYVKYYNYTLVSASEKPASNAFMPSPYSTIPARLFQITFGHSDLLSRFIKKQLRKTLITSKTGKGDIYVPSARYYSEAELK